MLNWENINLNVFFGYEVHKIQEVYPCRYWRYHSITARDFSLLQMWLGFMGAKQNWCELTHIFSLWHFCLLSHKSLSMTPESGERCEEIIHPLTELPINLAVRCDSTSVSSGWSTGGHNFSRRWWCFFFFEAVILNRFHTWILNRCQFHLSE